MLGTGYEDCGINMAVFPRGPFSRMSKVHQGRSEGIKTGTKVRSFSYNRKLSW